MSDNQSVDQRIVGKLGHILNTSKFGFRKEPIFSPERLLFALENPAPRPKSISLEGDVFVISSEDAYVDGLASAVVNFIEEAEHHAKMTKTGSELSGVVTPLKAEDTGLIPESLSLLIEDGVAQDFPEGLLDWASLDYSGGFLKETDRPKLITGGVMLERADELGAIGSLGLAHRLLEAQSQGRQIFPVESRGVHVFIMPRTRLVFNGGSEPEVYVPAMEWKNGLYEWVLRWHWVVSDPEFRYGGSGFGDQHRFIRLLKLK